MGGRSRVATKSQGPDAYTVDPIIRTIPWERSNASSRTSSSPYGYLVPFALLRAFPSRMRVARPANDLGADAPPAVCLPLKSNVREQTCRRKPPSWLVSPKKGRAAIRSDKQQALREIAKMAVL